MEIKGKEPLERYSLIVESLSTSKSPCFIICHSCIAGMSPSVFNKPDYKPPKTCVLRLSPRSHYQLDIATANKFEALQMLKKIAHILKQGEEKKAEEAVIKFFLTP